VTFGPVHGLIRNISAKGCCPNMRHPLTKSGGYDHNFRRKNGVFLENQFNDPNFAKTSSVLSEKRKFYHNFFGENIFKIITSLPLVDVMFTFFCDF
jgi:hypothetical protein